MGIMNFLLQRKSHIKTKLCFYLPFLIALGALILRWEHVKTLASNAWYFQALLSDSYVYMLNAYLIKSGKIWEISAQYPGLLYPCFLAGVLKIFNENPFFIIMIQIILSSLSVLLIFHITNKIYGFFQASIAAFIATFYPVWIYMDGLILKPALIIFFTCLYFYHLVQKDNLRLNQVIPLSSVILGVLCLLRGNFLLWIPLHCLRILKFSQNKYKALFFSLVLIGITLSPATIYNYLKYKDFILTYSQGGLNLYTGNNPYNHTGYYQPLPFIRPSGLLEEADFKKNAEKLSGKTDMKPSEVSKFWADQTLSYLRSDPKSFFYGIFKKTLIYFDSYEVPDGYDYQEIRKLSFIGHLRWLNFPLLASFALCSLVFSKNEHHSWLVLFLSSYLLSIILFFIFDRFKIVTIPFIIILASNSCYDLMSHFKNKKYILLFKKTAFLLIAFLLLQWNPFRLKVDDQSMWKTINLRLSHQNELLSPEDP